MREYEHERDVADQLSERRRLEIHSLIPRVAEIEMELAKTGHALAKKVINMSYSGTFKKQLKEFKTANLALQKEKATLMKKAGFPADYIENVFKCPDCKDTGYIDGRTRCNCLVQRLISRQYVRSNLSEVIEYENFREFNIAYYSDDEDEIEGISPRENIKLILGCCLRFVDNFDKTFSNIILYGPTGLGKTFLCNCMARELLDTKHSVLYATAPQLLNRLEEMRFRRNEGLEDDGYFDFVISCDLLIIDDLGTEFISIVTTSDLFNIINTRLLHKKPVVISTNLSMENIQEQYSERLTSRIVGYYRLLKVFGEDIRTIKRFYSSKGKNSKS